MISKIAMERNAMMEIESVEINAMKIADGSAETHCKTTVLKNATMETEKMETVAILTVYKSVEMGK